MSNLDKITQKILADARKEADVINAECEAECVRIKKESEEKAAEIYGRMIESEKKESERQIELGESAAISRSRKEILALKQMYVAEAFDRAVEMTLNMPDDEYKALVAGWIADASVTGNEKVILTARDKERFANGIVDAANDMLRSRGMNGALTVELRDGTFLGGAVVTNGNVEQNLTLEAICSEARQKLSSSVAGILFRE